MSSSSEEEQRVVMDRAYQNGAFIPGAEGYFARWEAKAAAFRAGLGPRARLDLAYGPGPRQRFDLLLPEGAPQGLALFFHGGYWIAGERSLWSHLAAGPLARGWAVALPGYTLAPEASVAAMTLEAGLALAAAAALVPGPIAVTGHSAGGHLAARLACTDVALPPEVTARLRRAVPISPLADLRPLRLTGMNDLLQLDPAAAEAESPALRTRRAGCAVTVHVGQQERPAFLWQARLLSEAWDCPWQIAPARHHYDVIDDLEDPHSPLTNALL